MKLVVTKSDSKGKKLKAVFTDEYGKTKTIHFGQSGATDFTLGASEDQRKRYRERHSKENWNNYQSAGSLSRYILWGESRSREQNIKSFKKRFNLE